MKSIQREHLWLGFVALGLLFVFLAAYHLSFSLLAIIFLIIGIKGIKYDML